MRLIQSETQPNSAGRMRGVQEQIRSGSESSEGKETREEQREEVATGSTAAEQKLKSLAEGMTQAQMIWARVAGWNVHEERETRRWTEQSSEGIVEPWEVSAGGNDRSSEDPNKSREVEQLGRAERNGQTELRTTHQRYSEPKPSRDREFREECAERARGMATENSGAADRKPEETSAEGMTEVRKMRTKCREVERFGNKGQRVGQSSGAMQQGCSDHIPTEIFGDIRICGGPKAITQPANCSSTREMSGTKGTETECSEGNFAKSCEGNRRRAPKIAGGANRGLEGSTERDSRLKRSLGDARPKGDQNPEEPEEGREGSGLLIEQPGCQYIWPGPGEDVWDFGKDVRDPERPESFSGASLGNRKSQNTIRTSVRGARAGKKIVDRKDLVTTLRSFAQRSNSDGVPSANGKDRGRAEATGSTGRFRSKPKGEGEEGVEVEDEQNGTGRTQWSGTNSRSRKVEGKNREIPGIRCPKSRNRPRWKRGSAEASETRSRYRRTSPDEGPSTTREDKSTSDTEAA
ncbi:hypothetical protein DFH06DRAFT_1152134 [Mycena polygramma]|nr:hypothetical protein DFH06DRAFT_1152134 [Mycena polygramma]